MPDETVDALIDAIRRLAGSSDEPAAGPGSPADGLARLILAAAQDERDGVGCPASVLQRLYACRSEARGGWLGRLAQLRFDSWAEAAPAAARGAAAGRLLRFEDDMGTLDVQMETGADGSVAVLIALEGALFGGRVAACTRAGDVLVEAPITDRLTARLALPATCEAFALRMQDAEGIWFETPPIPVERGSAS